MLLVGLAILLAVASLALDALLPRMPPLLPFAPGGPEGARPVLSTVAASMITVAGLVFSLTLVILSVAAQQPGPRLIPLFMADRLFQTAIGSFLALFVYALLVLRGVRSESEAIHAISLTLLLVATLANVFLLVAYIHRAAASIQADSVVARLGREALATIEALPRAEDHPAEPATQDGPRTPVGTVACPASGYVQAIDTGSLLDLARRHDLCIVLHLHPGAFAIEGTPLAELHGRDGRVDDGILSAVAGAVALGAKHTDTQDPVYALQGLAEIALRALSPGINDPFTAIAWLDWLTAVWRPRPGGSCRPNASPTRPASRVSNGRGWRGASCWSAPSPTSATRPATSRGCSPISPTGWRCSPGRSGPRTSAARSSARRRRCPPPCAPVSRTSSPAGSSKSGPDGSRRRSPRVSPRERERVPAVRCTDSRQGRDERRTGR